MNTYDEQHYSPPAPIVALSLRTLGDGIATVSNVIAIIDTGADVTLLPRWAIEQLGLMPVADAAVQLEWFDGSSRPAESVELEVTFQGGKFLGRFPIVDQPHGIVGRNILNHFRLLFDGPAKTWQRVLKN